MSAGRYGTHRSVHRSLLILIILAALLGCATGSGTLFESEVRASEDRPPGSTEENNEGNDESDDGDENRPGLYIRTSPNRARVFVNGRDQGRSPMRLELPTGRYQIYAEREGYRPTQVTVSYTAGTAQDVRLELQEMTGRIRIDIEPREARVSGAYRQLHAGRTHELRVGTYELTISAFGYEPAQQTVVVRENITSTLSVRLKPASFRVLSFTPRVTRFSPGDPGRLGAGSVRVGVSAPGRAEYRILDARGRERVGPVRVDFSQALTTLSWDGRDQDGVPVPDGAYQFVLSGEDGGREATTLTVDRSVSRGLRPVFGAAAGTLFSPLPASFPRGSGQISFLAVAHASGGGQFLAPALVALRFGVGRREELVVSAGGILRGPRDLAAASVPFASTSWSRPLFYTGGAAGSVVFRASFFPDNAVDPFENASGFATAIPVSTTVGPLTLAIAPEFVVAGPVSDAPDTGIGSLVSLFGYARTAAVLDLGSTRFAASAAMRLRPLGSQAGIDWPASAGLELQQTFPEEQFAFSALGTLRYDPHNGWYISTGLGLHALWW